MLVKVYTDASYCPIHKVGSYAFYISSPCGTIASCGILREVSNPMDSEMMTIANSLHALLKSSIVREKISFIEIYSDCLGSFKNMYKDTKHPIGKVIVDKLAKLKAESSVKDERIGIHRLIHVKAHTEFKDKASLGNKYCHDMAKHMLAEARKKKTVKKISRKMEIEINIVKVQGQKKGHLAFHGVVEDKGFVYVCEICKEKGAVLIKNYTVGVPHIGHPNMDKSGNLEHMRQEGGWLGDKIIQVFDGFVNMDKVQIEHPLDALALWLEQNPKAELENRKVRLSLQTDGTPSVVFLDTKK